MMNGFNVEESNLLSIYAGESRTEVMGDISRAMGYLRDSDLIELSGRVLERLKDMNDEEVAGLEFAAAE